MGENDDMIEGPLKYRDGVKINEVCKECRHLFNIETGEWVEGWTHAKFVSCDENDCGWCRRMKEAMIVNS